MEEIENIYTNDYLETHDIDWFCIINNQPVHAASDGGDLPDIIKNDKNKNIEHQKFVYSIDEKDLLKYNQIHVNSEHLSQLFDDKAESSYEVLEMKQNYLRSFVDMARRGFYSFDRLKPKKSEESEETKSNTYILVAWPQKYYRLKGGKYNQHIGFKFSSNDIDFHNIYNNKTNQKSFNIESLLKKT